MNSIELKHKAIAWLEAQSKIVKMRPYPFPPKIVAEAVGGSYTSLGGVLAQQVVTELCLRGVNIRYDNNTRPRQFVLLSGGS